MRQWKQLHGKGLWRAWAICGGVVFLIFSPLFVSAILQSTLKGWMFLAACAVGGLIGAALFLALLGLLGRLLCSLLYGLTLLLPNRLKQKIGESAGRPLNRSTGLAIIGGFVVSLIAFFAWRFHSLAVTIPLIMVAVVAGFFSLVNRLDLRLQARKARKATEANNTSEGIRQPADGSPKPSM